MTNHQAVSETENLIVNEIAGLEVTELARRFGTPTYVYDAAIILQRRADLSPFDTVRYAQKACSNLAILDLLRRAGTLVDAVSAMEVRRALAAGYTARAEKEGDPPPIVYTADIFDHDALSLCIEHGIHVNCGSPDMIDQWADALEESDAGDDPINREITLRINPGFGHGHSQKTNTGGPSSKHGIWYEQLQECVARAAARGLTVIGLHMHIGSGTDMEHLSQVCGAMESAAFLAGSKIRTVSTGGGLPTVYKPGDPEADINEYYRLWDEMRRRLQAEFGHEVHLEIEPGRYLAAESGYLLAEVRAVKHQADKLYYLVDAGFNNLARPILYGSYHPISLAPADGAQDRPLTEASVGGPLCESGDIFTQEEGGFVVKRTLPEAQVGDILVIRCAGAYSFVMGSNYNSRPLAAEVLIRDGKAEIIRERQTFEDITRGERIPE